MSRKIAKRFLLLLGISLLFLTGCQQHANLESTAMSQNVSINIGEQGAAFAKRYPDKIRVIHQPVGADFYKIDWDVHPRGMVVIDHGAYSFTIEDVLGVSGYQNLDGFENEGLTEFNIYSGITAPDLIPHDEARQKMHVILQRILQAGWKINITRSMPRLRGKDALNYAFIDGYTSLDASYIPTFEEWMRIESRTAWRFYADHVYLSVNFTREHTLTDPTKPGSYLVSFNLTSENAFYRGYIDGEGENHKNWKTLLPAELAKLVPVRAEVEAKLRAQGIKIDETYQDPPLPDLGGK